MIWPFFSAVLVSTTCSLARLHPRITPSRDQRALDEAMIESILSLYRSAVDIAQELSLPPSSRVPTGLALVPLKDPYLSAASSIQGGRRLGARIVELDHGHWWMLENPSRSAKVLQEFWWRVDEGHGSDGTMPRPASLR